MAWSERAKQRAKPGKAREGPGGSMGKWSGEGGRKPSQGTSLSSQGSTHGAQARVTVGKPVAALVWVCLQEGLRKAAKDLARMLGAHSLCPSVPEPSRGRSESLLLFTAFLPGGPGTHPWAGLLGTANHRPSPLACE